MRIRKLLVAIAVVIASATSSININASTAPKYVFYFIGDGMGVGSVALAQTYNRMVLGAEQPLTMLLMPVTSLAWTYSASSPVTDSAAAGTALATGHKTKNGMLGMTADTISVESIAAVLHDKGYGVGLITSVAPDDATPAAFYAHVPARSQFYDIGCQAAASGYEFIAGANLRGLKDKDGNTTDLEQHFEKNGVAIVRGLDALKNTDNRNIVLLAEKMPNDNEIGYVIDSIEGAMTLPAMTEACLNHLQRVSPDGFFMMVEGGAIDHAGHANDAATNILETLAFDQSLALAVDFMRQHPEETLIVVTADHETGGLALASRSIHYNMNPQALQYQRMSKGAFSDYCKTLLDSPATPSWDDMKHLLSENLGLFNPTAVPATDEARLKEIFDLTFEKRAADEDVKGLYDSFNLFAEEAYSLVNRLSGVGWTTGDHSGAPVPVFAAGVGAERFSSMHDNTELPQKILQILEVERP